MQDTGCSRLTFTDPRHCIPRPLGCLTSLPLRSRRVIKLWDLRKAAARRINPPSVEESLDFAATPTRSYGTASLCLSPDGAKVYALSTNSK